MGIELRSHINDTLWRSFFDFTFSVASLLLAVFFGAAVGNVVRGVPLNADGYFFEALWTNFRVGTDPGILDWYTVLIGVLAFVTLTVHGANYLLVKTEGDVQMRARRLAHQGWLVLVLMTALSLTATLYIRPQVLDNFRLHVWGWIIPVAVAGALIFMRYCYARRQDVAAFFSSVVYILCMLGGAAFAMHPLLLPATTDPSYSLTIYNSQTGAYSLGVGLVWWMLGIALAVGYFTFLYRSFRGKVRLEESAEGGGH
jgi:cytochrome bd ubiquinol oxidase subunit II